jgi:hypothetical protein
MKLQREDRGQFASYSLFVKHISDHGNGTNTFLRNVGALLPDYTGPYPRG